MVNDLAEIHEELVEEIRNGFSYLEEPVRIAELGDVFDTFSVQLEALALCHLFEKSDQSQFRENMARRPFTSLFPAPLATAEELG